MICHHCQGIGQAFSHSITICSKCYYEMKVKVDTLESCVSRAKQIYAGHYHVKPTIQNIMKALDGELFFKKT